jgi:hypothetical protein
MIITGRKKAVAFLNKQGYEISIRTFDRRVKERAEGKSYGYSAKYKLGVSDKFFDSVELITEHMQYHKLKAAYEESAE